jgi:5'-methylthioadenosine phosphorylase
VLGILGGSGVYELAGLENARWEKVSSPLGEPSDELLFGELHGQPLVFLPRHGREHRLPPSKIDFRANVDALKRVGVTQLLSLSAVGSLREELSPGTFVIVDQYVDRTFARAKTFFDEDVVAHVSMAHPVCARMNDALEVILQTEGVPHRRGGTYLAMEGPQFSTLAESNLYRAWSCDVIGMTNMPEAKLAREAEICYASVAMVTDYDCWHPEHDHVSVEMIVRTLNDNAARARGVVAALAPLLAGFRTPCERGCSTALDNAIITPKAAWSERQLSRLGAILARVRER